MAVKTCVPIGRSGSAIVTGLSKMGSKACRTYSRWVLRLINTETGSSSRATWRAASAAAARAASAAAAASRAAVAASSFGCSSALAASHCACSSAILAAACALAPSACSFASAEIAEPSAVSAAANCASALSFRFSAARTGTVARVASRKAVAAASLAWTAFLAASCASAVRAAAKAAAPGFGWNRSRMDDLNGRHVAWRHDHPHAHRGRVEQACGEVVGHPDAAMGRRIPRQGAAVERDARPGDALHVGHEGIVIQVRVMLLLFLDDAEDSGGRLASLLAARHRRPQDPALGVVDGDPLVAERNNGHDRLAGGARLDEIDRAFALTASGAGMISGRDERDDSHNGKTPGPRSPLAVPNSHNKLSCASHLIGSTPVCTHVDCKTQCHPVRPANAELCKWFWASAPSHRDAVARAPTHGNNDRYFEE